MHFNYLLIAIQLLLILTFPLQAEEKGDIKKYEDQLRDTTNRRPPEGKHEDNSSDSGWTWEFYEFSYGVFRSLFIVTENEIDDFYDGIWPGFNDYSYCPKELNEKNFTGMKQVGYQGGRQYRSGLYNNTRAGLEGRGGRLMGTTSYFRHGSGLDGYQIAIRGGFATLFELSFESSGLREEIPGGIDRLQLTNIFLEYNRLRYSEFVIRWGLGWKGVSGDDIYVSGGVSLGAEVYPFSPLSLYYHYSGAAIGSAFVSEHQFRLNIHHNRYFGHVGYQTFRAGDEGIPGLLVGVGVGF